MLVSAYWYTVFPFFRKILILFLLPNNRCSEQRISLAEFRELLPSRCSLGAEFCQATCHTIGRRDGSCEYGEVSIINSRSSAQFKL